MKSFYLLKLCLLLWAIQSLLICPIFAQTNVPSGVVSGTWTLNNSPYMIQGNVQIPVGSSLTIQPGVKVLFQGYYKIHVKGALSAKGTVTDSIHFTMADTTAHSNIYTAQGGWQGIFFDKNVDTSFIEYANIGYYKDTIRIGYTYPLPAAISTHLTDKVVVSHSLIHHCLSGKVGNAVSLEQGKVQFHHNLVSNCRVDTSVQQPNAIVSVTSCPNIEFHHNEVRNSLGGRIVQVNNSDKAKFHHNYIHHNQSYWQGGGLMVIGMGASSGSIDIDNNIISYNQSHISGGGIFIQGFQAYMRNNLIANNNAYNKPNWACPIGSGGGGLNIQDVELFLYNNIFVNNTSSSYGGAIVVENSYINIINNTICNNKAAAGGLGNAGGLYAYADFTNSSVYNYPHKVCNNIFYGNRDTTWQDNISDQLILSGSYDILEGKNNQIETTYLLSYPNFTQVDTLNPQFISPSTGIGHTHNGLNANWNLKPISPCINSGTPDTSSYGIPLTDFSGNIRIVGDTIDRGAYEYRIATNIDVFHQVPYKIYPNPNTGKCYLDIPPAFIGQNLSIWDMQGQKVGEEIIQTNHTLINIDTRPSGIYLLRVGAYSVKIIKE